MYDILSDDEKRKYYDLYGDTEPSREHVNVDARAILCGLYRHMCIYISLLMCSGGLSFVGVYGAFEYTLGNEDIRV